jgi:hypothetical protein
MISHKQVWGALEFEFLTSFPVLLLGDQGPLLKNHNLGKESPPPPLTSGNGFEAWGRGCMGSWKIQRSLRVKVSVG